METVNIFPLFSHEKPMLVYLLTYKIKFLGSLVPLNSVQRVVENSKVGQSKKKRYNHRCILREATEKFV